MGGADMQFCLKWNNFGTTMTGALHSLHEGGDFVDVTLAADGSQLTAHKLVLSACSPYFRDILKNNPCQHPVIILREVPFDDLEAVVTFMYEGQVNVSQKRLHTFMKLAEALQVRGLTDSQNAKPKEKDFYQSLVSASDNNNSSSAITASAVTNEISPDNQISTPQPPRAHSQQQLLESQTITRIRANESPPRVPVASKRRRSSSNNQKSSPSRNEQENMPEENNEYKRDIQNMLEVKMEPSEYGDDGEFDAETSNPPGDLNYIEQQQDILRLTKGSSALTIPSSHPVFTMSGGRQNQQDKSSKHTLARRNSHEKTAVQNLQPEFPIEPNCANLPYPCPFCEKAYTSWGFRRRHIKGYHTVSQELPCKWCYTVLPSHPDWEEHVTRVHNLASADARNGLMILDEAHMVLQIAAPTRIDTLMELIKNKKNGEEGKDIGNKKDKDHSKNSKKDSGEGSK